MTDEQSTPGRSDHTTSGRTSDQPISDWSNVSMQMSMPPRWALGYHESYTSTPSPEDVVERVRRFRRTDTPIESVQINRPSVTSTNDPPGSSAHAELQAAVDDLRALGIYVMSPEAEMSENSPTSSSDDSPETVGRASVYARPTETADDVRPFHITGGTSFYTRRQVGVSFPVDTGSWEDLRAAAADCLTISNGGYALCGPRIDLAASCAPAIAARWIQLAVFLPLLRVNLRRVPLNTDAIWPLSNDEIDIWRRYLGFRYKLLPYLYSSFDAYRRSNRAPVWSDGPHSPAVKQFRLGSSLLVSPVTAPDPEYAEVDLPDGTWVHLWSHETFAGQQTIRLPAPLEHIPVFARAGAIIPFHPFMCQTNSYLPSTLVLRAFPHGTCESTLYFDDGVSFDYVDGRFCRLLITSSDRDDRFSLRVEREGDYTLPYTRFEWQLPLDAIHSIRMDDRVLKTFDDPEAFVSAPEGVFYGREFVRVRTPAEVNALDVQTGPSASSSPASGAG